MRDEGRETERNDEGGAVRVEKPCWTGGSKHRGCICPSKAAA